MSTDSSHGFDRLAEIMHTLRAPGGCPWDAQQTHESLKPYLIEEAYELLDAIDAHHDDEICDELGDVLLQVVFHAELAAERKAFGIADVVATIADKLVRRHPHVFSDVQVENSAEVTRNWNEIKHREQEQKFAHTDAHEQPSAVDGVPRGMPSLMRAHRVGRKAAVAGFDWKDPVGVHAKIQEELAEIHEAAAETFPTNNVGANEQIGREIGDLLLAVSSLARHYDLNGEQLLHDAVDRFEARFRFVEDAYRNKQESMVEASEEALAEAWNQAKKLSPQTPNKGDQ